MKILIGMSLLQTVAVIVLILMIRNDPVNQASQQSTGINSGAMFNARAVQTDGAPSIDENRLRTIIREELASQKLAAVNPQASAVEAPVDAQTAKKLADRRDRVAQKIASLKGIGPVPDSQMQELLGEIEELDEQGRRQSMAMLARGINEGAIKGRL